MRWCFLENINEYIKEAPLEIIHSSAEGYMKDIDQLLGINDIAFSVIENYANL